MRLAVIPAVRAGSAVFAVAGVYRTMSASASASASATPVSAASSRDNRTQPIVERYALGRARDSALPGDIAQRQRISAGWSASW